MNPTETIWKGGGLQAGHRTLSPEGVEEIDRDSLRAELERRVRGDVWFDGGNIAAYTHDSSNYRQPPLGVVCPLDADDLASAISACRHHNAPVVMRGCGTSLSGETCNVAVICDVSRHMTEIGEIDTGEGWAWVDPGVIRDQLSNMTEDRWNLTFAPDTSTHEYATFGGMIGNNSCGIHSVMGGRTADNVYEMEVLTYDGERLTVGETSDEELERIVSAGGRRGEIYAGMRDLRDRYAELIRERYPDIPRRVSGYNLDELLPEKGFNVARLLVGSEGTLASVLRAKVRLMHSPPARSLLVLGYADAPTAGDHVSDVLEHGPVGLEAIDAKLVEHNMQLLELQRSGRQLLPDGDAWLLVEFGGEDNDEADEKARKTLDALSADSVVGSHVYDDREALQKVWAVREAGLGATAHLPLEGDHWPGWEDAAIPPAKVGEYLREFQDLLDRYDYKAALYGHFGDGCIHCRISFDLRSAAGLKDWRGFLDDAADLVVSHGGSLSGEHGDGQARAELLEKMYGPELLQAFRELKSIWDPEGRMNPHKVVDPYPIVSNMKLGADYNPPEPDVHFAYSDDNGSFARATMRCVGAGLCRKHSGGTMCPSYKATHEEKHSTRGRARILYEMLEGETITDGFRSEEVADALDLCLSCKGCATDCPVSVDMATYKAEFLSKHYKGRLRPLAAYSMGLIMFHARAASLAPGLANALTGAPVIGDLIKRAGGLTTERGMPPFAGQTFRSWFADRAAVNPHADPVALFADTFNDYLHPEVLKACVRVLEAAGYRVEVPQGFLCCGRPLYDYGMLDTAEKFWRRNLSGLRKHIHLGVPIVVAEPSCLAGFRDELPKLFPRDEDAKRLAHQACGLEGFLSEHASEWELPRLDRKALVHIHCHQEATVGQSADEEILDRLGLDYEVLDSGCCGLAGSFGFEADHHDISVQIAEQVLLPAFRDAPAETLLVSDGFSCKTQVAQLSERRPLHLAQVIAMAIDEGPSGPSGAANPEAGYLDVEPAQIGSGALIGAAALAGLAVAAGLRRAR
ncbi:MAG: FAD-binding and (Fe-S)-binding domain-containing protein [Solirubrobacterales bacterium]